MELYELMRNTPGVREYTDEDVPDEVLHRVLDNARFAPSGGNRQGWRVIILRDPAKRGRLAQLYREMWADYVPKRYGPLEDLEPRDRRRLIQAEKYVAELHEIPVYLLVWVEMAALEITDRNLDRLPIVGGGSIYPFVHNINLALRYEGLGSRVTTLMSYHEPEVREMVDAPDGFALATTIMVGYPVHVPTKLFRHPVEDFASHDRFGGPRLLLGETRDDGKGGTT